MPNPARIMGVNPILGLTTEPLNELIGDCCDLSGAVRVCKIGLFAQISYTLYSYLFEVTTGLVSEHDAEIMDALKHCAQGQTGPR
jgi:hypothetical protein